MNIRFNVGITVCAVLAFCGCGPRSSGVRRTGAAVASSSAAFFAPARYVARPTLGLGSRYGNLLSPDTYAIWFTDEVAEVKLESDVAGGTTPGDSEELLRMAKQLNEKYLILECHIVSAFPDSSIAYDITSFRHADVFLLDDGGTKYEPLQLIIGSLERESQEALKKFRRVNLLVFPKYDLFTGKPVIDSETPEVSLVISGYNTNYFFSWSNLSTAPRQPDSELQLQELRATSLQSIESVLRFLVQNLE